MITKENMSTKEFVLTNKKLFEDVAKEYSRPVSSGERYTQLNYDRILNDMCEYIDGYIKYKNNGEDHLKALFAVNVGKKVGLGFRFNYIYARGYYQNQSAAHFNYTLYGSYLGDRYEAHLLMSTNHEKMAENGKTPILDVQELGIDFGGLTAVNDLNLQVFDGEIAGLIGPNGAGKTTVFNLLTKVYKPTRGKIFFDGKDTAGKSVVDINKAGIARTFQNIRLFGNLSVLDNVKTGFHNVTPYSPITAILRLPKFFASEKEIDEKARDLLKIMELDDYADYLASNLPYGAQRRLEIARALATNPKLLLLDEPAAGMNPQETEELMDMIRFVRDHFGIAILLIEHDMKLVMGICERITVLNYGMMLAQGTPEEIQSNPEVIKAYLGD